MQKYINMFTASAPILIKKLTTALLNIDFEEIANQVHGYKTKWIMMGMNDARDHALKIEMACRKETPDNVQIINSIMEV